ncbi:MAG: alpha/beta fold hydrolase [Proteobacteria bacterium]|nr:alpha/beta fold hydrolase [Pseudomonadota bacterium]
MAAGARAPAPAGYRLATYDQRGHGASTPLGQAADYALEEFVADALDALDALGWERAAVGGLSMGASVALRLALDHPGRVERLLLAAPAFGWQPSAAVERFDELADGIEALGVEGIVAGMRAAGPTRSPASEQRIASWAAHERASLVLALRTVGRWVALRDPAEPERLRVPAAVLAWPDDPMHPLELAQSCARALGAPLGLLESAEQALADPPAIGRLFSALLDPSRAGP